MEAHAADPHVPLEGHSLPFHLPSHFERFYRANLRRVTGSRLGSSDLHARYLGWASAEHAPAISFAQQREYLEAIGHRRIQSNGIQYADLGYASDFPKVADTLCLPLFLAAKISARRDGKAIGALVAKVDASLASLLDLRRALLAAKDTVAPHVAAQLALGLFDR